MSTTGFCRDCLTDAPDGTPRCQSCKSPRLLRHPALNDLSIAHVDCDAFYATIEKRDNPDLKDKPVAVGGSTRGVVAAACYVARTYGIRSAMPMFEAKRRCPHLVVVKPDMAKYVTIGRDIRRMMLDLTPQVEPLSIDEAFLDLAGTARLHGMSIAKVLARFAKDVEKRHRITVSIGLAPNKFLAKIASDLDKPRGFAALSADEAPGFLAPKPVGFIYGVGKVTAERLQAAGYKTIADLQRTDRTDLMRHYGEEGLRLSRLAFGLDDRKVEPERETKSVSSETTFDRDIGDFRPLERILWQQCERVSTRLKAQGLAGVTVTLKLKSADFKIRTRARALSHPTQMANLIFAAGRDLLEAETTGTKFRLLGIGLSQLSDAAGDDLADLLNRRSADAEIAVDRLRAKFGRNAVVKGLSLDEE